MAISIRRQATTVKADPKEKRRIAERLEKILCALRLERADLSVLITSREKMRDLNKLWRHKTYYPRILSFPQSQPPDAGVDGRALFLGDIAISDKPGISDRLLAHSVLHLLGYEHDSDKGYEKMKSWEDRVLAALKKL